MCIQQKKFLQTELPASLKHFLVSTRLPIYLAILAARGTPPAVPRPGPHGCGAAARGQTPQHPHAVPRAEPPQMTPFGVFCPMGLPPHPHGASPLG